MYNDIKEAYTGGSVEVYKPYIFIKWEASNEWIMLGIIDWICLLVSNLSIVSLKITLLDLFLKDIETLCWIDKA
jgi:hypothetical protein